jgi:dihydroorotase
MEKLVFESSFKAVQLAKKHGSRLHILHISTEKELQLFTNLLPLEEKENHMLKFVCIIYILQVMIYARLGNLIKCNPAIKAPNNKAALWDALLDDRLDVIATDHAPQYMGGKKMNLMKKHTPVYRLCNIHCY